MNIPFISQTQPYYFLTNGFRLSRNILLKCLKYICSLQWYYSLLFNFTSFRFYLQESLTFATTCQFPSPSISTVSILILPAVVLMVYPSFGIWPIDHSLLAWVLYLLSLFLSAWPIEVVQTVENPSRHTIASIHDYILYSSHHFLLMGHILS